MAGKPELINRVATESGLTKAQAGKVVDSVLQAITDTLAQGDSVALSGFGTFKVTSTAARPGRNPATGEPMTIGPGKRIGFSAGSRLSSAVKGTAEGEAEAKPAAEPAAAKRTTRRASTKK
jgi:DNA-binding protein HU-beta